MPSTSGSGPASTHARSSSCRVGLSFSGRPGRGRLRSPARPSALKRTTASRSDWRSRPTRRAASARLAPSNACAIASARKAAQRSASPCANRRNSAAPTSSRIIKPCAPIRLPPSNTPEGNHTSATPRITSESAIVATGIRAGGVGCIGRRREQRCGPIRRSISARSRTSWSAPAGGVSSSLCLFPRPTGRRLRKAIASMWRRDDVHRPSVLTIEAPAIRTRPVSRECGLSDKHRASRC